MQAGALRILGTDRRAGKLPYREQRRRAVEDQSRHVGNHRPSAHFVRQKRHEQLGQEHPQTRQHAQRRRALTDHAER